MEQIYEWQRWMETDEMKAAVQAVINATSYDIDGRMKRPKQPAWGDKGTASGDARC